MIDPNVIIYILFATIMFWQSSLSILKKGKLFQFLPFLILGIVYCLQATLVFYNLYDHITIILARFLYLGILIWFFFSLKHQKYDRLSK